MTPADLLARLAAAGFAVRAEGGRLLVSPASRLTAADRAEIAAARDGLLWELEAADASAYEPEFDRPAVLAELAVVDLGDGRRVVLEAARWEAFRAWAARSNAASAERWKKHLAKKGILP